MLVHSLEAGPCSLEAAVDLGDETARLVWRASDGPVTDTGDPLLAATLLSAMRRGEPLRVEAPVSPALLGSVRTIQDVFHMWDRGFARIEVDAPPAAPAEPGPRGVACFFSGGVDSFYTVLTRPDVTHLVFVHGFDTPLAPGGQREDVTAALRAAAAELGKPLVEVETNARRFTEPDLTWEMAHGGALASVALALAPRFRIVYVPATHTYADLLPMGSHPLLDPLWGTEQLRIVHDGAGLTRPEKIALVAESEIALRWLRVCWERPGGAYNCGRCEKCLRTMVGLRLAGALERCRTFPVPLDLRRVARISLRTPGRVAFWREDLEEAIRRGADPALIRALRTAIRAWRRRRLIRGVRREAGRRLRRVLGRVVGRERSGADLRTRQEPTASALGASATRGTKVGHRGGG